MTERYPGYNVLNKRNSPSWNDKTRGVIDARIALDPELHRFFNETEWKTLCAVCAQIIPQSADRPLRVPLAAMLDQKLHSGNIDGYRDARLPPMAEAWRQGLAAIEAEATLQNGKSFCEITDEQQRSLLTAIQAGKISSPAWQNLPPALFFIKRLLHDIAAAYYGHPASWNEIGFGGPASPRGYVRMNYDRRDPWEAAEAIPGREAKARRENERVG
jgi:hypothetical protein